MNDKPTDSVPLSTAASSTASPSAITVTVDPNNLAGLPLSNSSTTAVQRSVQTTQVPNIIPSPLTPPKTDNITSVSSSSSPLTPPKTDNITSVSKVKLERPTIQGKSTDPVKFKNLLNEIQNDSQYLQVNGMQSMATIKQSNNMESSATPIGSGLQQNEQLLKEILKRGKSTDQQNEINKALQTLQPIFANIGDVLSFQSKEMKDNKDFYNQHYTVSPTQSVFNMTANQIMEMPSWRR